MKCSLCRPGLRLPPVTPPCPLLRHQTAHTQFQCISLADKAPEGVASQNTGEKIEP